ncbi:MAG: hypothetical protein QOI83_2493, partial [Streptomycetaceae bacterium]|nr:hypothetical protein [Streptomycetaceae bacterium]
RHGRPQDIAVAAEIHARAAESGTGLSLPR